MELRYTAIVLKKKEVGETDRLYVLYTKEAGKVRAIGKGVRKPAAKLAGQLETLTQVSVSVERRRGLGNISGAVAENFFPNIRSDYEMLRRVMNVVDALERLVEMDEPDAELFDLFLTYLGLADDLAKADEKEKILLLSEGFLFQLFAHLGYRIETGVCAVSGERLRPGERHFFSPSAGGILSGEHSHTDGAAFPVSESAIKLIRLFLGNRLENLTRIRVTERELREVRQVAARFYRWIER